MKRKIKTWLRQRWLRQLELAACKTEGIVWILDIDHTIAAAFPQPLSRFKSIRLAGLPAIVPMVQLVSFLRSNRPRDLFVFLSARELRHFPVTLFWLRKNRLIQNINELILVDAAIEKLDFLKVVEKVAKGGCVYVDDLTWGHELGFVDRYTDILAQLSRTTISYLGEDFIGDMTMGRTPHITFQNQVHSEILLTAFNKLMR